MSPDPDPLPEVILLLDMWGRIVRMMWTMRAEKVAAAERREKVLYIWRLAEAAGCLEPRERMSMLKQAGIDAVYSIATFKEVR